MQQVATCPEPEREKNSCFASLTTENQNPPLRRASPHLFHGSVIVSNHEIDGTPSVRNASVAIGTHHLEFVIRGQRGRYACGQQRVSVSEKNFCSRRMRHDANAGLEPGRQISPEGVTANSAAAHPQTGDCTTPGSCRHCRRDYV
jgi:hypothetical protein